MNFETNKQKGNSGLGMAIAYFSTKSNKILKLQSNKILKLQKVN